MRPKFTSTGVVTVSLGVTLILYGMLSDALIPLYVGLFLTLLTYISYVYVYSLINVVGSIELRRKLTPSVINEGRVSTIRLVVRNKSHALLPRTDVEDIVPDRVVVVKGSPKFSSTLTGGDSIELTYSVKGIGLGTHMFKEVKLSLSDFLGLISIDFNVPLESTLKVTPIFIESSKAPFIKGAEVSIGPLKAGKGFGCDIVGIRDYVPGDDVRRIVWKVFARIGKLMVREDVGESRPKVLLVTDLSLVNWVGKVGDTDAEWIMRLAASIAYWSLRNLGILDAVIFYGNKIDVLTDLRGGSGFNEYLLALTSAEPRTSSYYLGKALVDTVRTLAIPRHFIIFITGRGFIMSNPTAILKGLTRIEALRKYLVIIDRGSRGLSESKEVGWEDVKELLTDYALSMLRKKLGVLGVNVVSVRGLEDFFELCRELELSLYMR